MRTYELLYIIPSKFTDKEISGIAEQIEAVLRNEKASVLESRPFQKRPLAYPIKRCHFGIYGLIKFEGEEETVKQINEKLRLMSEVARHQISKYKETQRPEAIVTRKIATAPQIKKVQKIARPPVELKKPEKSEEKIKTAPKQKEEKIKLEELDKKLEEILKE